MAHEQTVTPSEKSRGSRFARIDNAVLQDKRLSYRARGVLAYVLSKPKTWRHSADRMAADSVEGTDAIGSALNELVGCGYAQREKRRLPSGKFESIWFFRESPTAEKPVSVTPSPTAEKPDSAPTAGLPAPVKPTLGEPAPGRPAPGKPALLETTGIRNDRVETIEKKEKEGALDLGFIESERREILEEHLISKDALEWLAKRYRQNQAAFGKEPTSDGFAGWLRLAPQTRTITEAKKRFRRELREWCDAEEIAIMGPRVSRMTPEEFLAVARKYCDSGRRSVGETLQEEFIAAGLGDMLPV